MIKIKNDIYWVGIKDWGVRNFHGHEFSTHRGSSYNSYLIKDEKTVLVDTAWTPYKEEYTERLEKEVGLKNIDMIVINHIEPDHGGSLGLLMSKIPDTPIYCTKNGADIIKKYFHKDWNFNIVKTGDTIKTGKYELVFIEMQMIHWPDSMATYVKGADLLLSNDAFGQHYSAETLFSDEADKCELYQEALKYYANILTPFSALIKKKLEQIMELNLPIDMIATSHGLVWRNNIDEIIQKYTEWSNDYNEGNFIVIYDTMYNSTKIMAKQIMAGIESTGVKCKLVDSAANDRSDLISEIFKAKGIVIGSCTINNTVLRSVASLLDDLKGLKFKGKVGAGFGSYGWSGEASKIISNKLEEAGIKLLEEPLQLKYNPTEEELKLCFEYGKKIAEQI
ncbi:MAG: flavodoxin domain-containing protein [Clostridia bacterium]|jgi:flavorubredoxin